MWSPRERFPWAFARSRRRGEGAPEAGSSYDIVFEPRAIGAVRGEQTGLERAR